MRALAYSPMCVLVRPLKGKWLFSRRDGQVGWRKIPTAADRNEAHAEAESRARNRRGGRRPVQQVPGDDNSGSAEGGERVQVRSQHNRDLIDQEVAQDTSANAGQHPEQRSDKRIDAERQRLLRAGNREQAKSSGIEQQHDWMKSLMFQYHRKVTPPAASETATYRQSLIAAGGTAPIRESLVTPPALPATNASTPTPNRSSLFFTPDAAPLRANTNVPIRSSVRSRLAVGSRGGAGIGSRYAASQAREATIRAATPVSSVGCRTGANRGL